MTLQVSGWKDFAENDYQYGNCISLENFVLQECQSVKFASSTLTSTINHTLLCVELSRWFNQSGNFLTNFKNVFMDSFIINDDDLSAEIEDDD
jgi:hypothetical protein